MQLSPVFNLPAFTDANGNPLSGAHLYAYEAGSFSVLKLTYSDPAGDVENANPIVLDNAGRLPAGVSIWLEPSPEAYNLVLTQADGTTVLQSFDNVTGVQVSSSSTGETVGVWVAAEGAATYLTPTSFSVVGNLTTQFAVGNRVRLTQSGGFTFGTVSAVSFSSPNTSVTIVNDGVALNASLTLAEYSILIANNETVDAGGVSYTSALSYSTAGTVGNKLKSLDTDIAALDARLDTMRSVWTASGTGTYAITVSPAVTSISTDSVFTVKFTNATAGVCTLNVNGLGAVAMKVLNSSGAKVDPNITAGMVSDVAYDGTNFIVLDALPAAAAAAAPRGYQAFASNGTFTTPADVYYLKVTCVGGGGGGGAAYENFDPESGSTYYPGGGGGGGAVVWTYIATTPGTSYSVAVGVGGAGATAAPGTGTTGGSSSFGVTLCTAVGGAGGQSAPGTSSGVGGAGGGTGTGLVIRGGNGLAGSIGGVGGAAPGWGEPSREYGGGGAGSLGSFLSTAGGAGYQGIVVVEW